jgi:protein NRD1
MATLTQRRASEAELRAMFSKYGEVQSCIVNHDKRHAFVKMVDRRGALAARNGMEQVHDPEILAKARSVSCVDLIVLFL